MKTFLYSIIIDVGKYLNWLDQDYSIIMLFFSKKKILDKICVYSLITIVTCLYLVALTKFIQIGILLYIINRSHVAGGVSAVFDGGREQCGNTRIVRSES